MFSGPETSLQGSLRLDLEAGNDRLYLIQPQIPQGRLQSRAAAPGVLETIVKAGQINGLGSDVELQ